MPFPAPGFALYVHWPFCLAKCPYCDFNSHVRDEVDTGRWFRALSHELDRLAGETSTGTLDSIFFGGGTPSLMPPEIAAEIIDMARRHWPWAKSPEITLEANPTSVEAGRLRAFKEAGVNRVSLGVQALDDASLTVLGRQHSAAEALAAADLAAGLFGRYSFDLIYARPGQTRAAWASELRHALHYVRDHISLYQLTIEPGTRFFTLREAGRLALLDDDEQADLWELTQDLLGEAGLPAYEVSNHAAVGAECRHNLVYWRSGDWLGIGPGAHGRLTHASQRTATEAVRLPEAWLRQVETQGHGEIRRVSLPAKDVLTELLLMGLRLTEGLPLERVERAAAACPEDPLDRSALARFHEGGMLATRDARLVATPAGRQRLSALLASLLR